MKEYDVQQPQELAQVTITCKEHDKVLANGIRQLLKEEYFVDTSIAYNDISFNVHRLVLAVFLPTLKEHMNDVPSGVTNDSSNVQILNLDYIASDAEDVRALIEFVYSGKVTIPKERVQHFSQLASDLNMGSVVKAVGEYWQTEEVLTKEKVGTCDEIVDDAGTRDTACATLTDEDDEQSEMPVISSIDEEATTVMEDKIRLDEYLGNLKDPSFKSSSVEHKVAEKIKSDVEEQVITRDPLRVLHNRSMQPSKLAIKTVCSFQSPIPVKSISKSHLNTTVKATRTRQLLATSVEGKGNIKSCASPLETNLESAEDSNASEQEEVVSDDSDWTPSNVSPKTNKTTAQSASTDQTKASVAISINKRQSSLEEASGANSSNKRRSTTRKRAPPTTTGVYACKNCGRKFSTGRSLCGHAKVCGKHPVNICDTCGYFTEKHQLYKEHMRKVHGIDPMKPDKAAQIFKCPMCPFTGNAKYKLRHHFIRRHTTEKKHKCPECEYSAMFKCEIDKHVSRYHRKESHFMCDICGIRYQMKGTLNHHVLVKHKGIKPHKCEYCKKEYSDKQSLTIHVQTKHTNNYKKQVCNVCGSTYINRWGLQYHMRRAHGILLEPLKKPNLPRQSETLSVVSTNDAVSLPAS